MPQVMAMQTSEGVHSNCKIMIETINTKYLPLACLLISLLCAAARAQDLEPRSYTNLPINQTFLLAGVLRSEGDLTPTSSSKLQDAELEIDAQVLGFAHTFALAGKSAKVGASASRLCYQGSAVFAGEFVEAQRCEYGDPKIKLTWNFYGAPALALQDFAQWDHGLVLGTSLQLQVPLGTHTSEHLINAGANRWMIRPGFGGSFRLGNWYFDATTSVRFFEDNDNFFQGSKREQDPLYSVQGHVVYGLSPGHWISLNANFFRGGETTRDGRKADDRQENSRWGLTYSVRINRHHSIKLNYSTGVVTRAGNDFDSYGLVWLYRL